MPIAPKRFNQTERKREAYRRKGTKQERGYGGIWEKLSLMKRAACPVCEVCNNAAATQVDHIIPFEGENDPLRLEWTNIQSICNRCHSWKTNVAKNKIARVVVVCGLPGTGKSTFCERQMPVTAALFDLDQIAAAMQPEWVTSDRRGIEVNALIASWRDLLIDRIAGGKFQTETWIIQSDIEKAAQTAMRLSARLVTCIKSGSIYRAEVSSADSLRE